MENSMLFELPFDPAYIIVILSGLVVILLILVIAAMAKLKKLSRNMIIYAGKGCGNTGGCDTGSAGGNSYFEGRGSGSQGLDSNVESKLPFFLSKILEWFDIMHFLEWEEH